MFEEKLKAIEAARTHPDILGFLDDCFVNLRLHVVSMDCIDGYRLQVYHDGGRVEWNSIRHADSECYLFQFASLE